MAVRRLDRRNATGKDPCRLPRGLQTESEMLLQAETRMEAMENNGVHEFVAIGPLVLHSNAPCRHHRKARDGSGDNLKQYEEREHGQAHGPA